MKTLSISGLNWANRHKRKFDAIISCEDPERFAKRLRYVGPGPYPERLRLRFVDLDRPVPEPYCNNEEFGLAKEEDVVAALSFAEQYDNILVHCTAGVGRSPAIGLAILAQKLGPNKEQEALDELLRIRPESVPNLLIVKHADAILGRSGRLLDTVLAFDARQPQNTTRRRLNRIAHLRDGVPEHLWDVQR